MAIPLVVTRLVTTEECPWLKKDYSPGAMIYTCERYTYGCIDYDNGFAATEEEDGDYPFFEFPHNAVRKFVEE